MMPPGTRSLRRARCSATRRFSASSSNWHGPAMRKSASRRNVTAAEALAPCGAATTTSVRRDELRALLACVARAALGARGRGPDEPSEERVRARGARFQLGVELAPDEPRVVAQLHDLNERSIG